MRSQRNIFTSFSRSFFTSSAVSIDWESCPRLEKIELAEELQTQLVGGIDEDDEPKLGRQMKESRVVGPENAATKELNKLTPVETDDRHWMPIRAFTNGYVNNRAAKVEVDPDTEWTLLCYKAYRSNGS